MTTASTAYEQHRARARNRQRSQTAQGQDIGAIPPVQDPDRRRQATRSLKAFCETYLATTFDRPWGTDHLEVIRKLQRVVEQGGLLTVAMPRGSGKSSLERAAALWAILTGRKRYVCLIAADDALAASAIKSIQTTLASSELLLADWPEAVYPIQALENETRRASGQRHHGQLTAIEWKADTLVMPTIPGSKASGATISTTGLTGSLRGQNRTLADGSTIRPDLVLIDDPQTTESAMSPSQTAKRWGMIMGDVLYLSGPGVEITGLAAVTVIAEDDLADRMLKSPEWQGTRHQMVYHWPHREDLWEKAREVREQGLKSEDNGKAFADFVRQNFEEMHEGSRVGWEHNYPPNKLSALHHAYDLRFRDEHAFWAECQNQPQTSQEAEQLTAADILAKTLHTKRGQPPLNTHTLTAFIDVHKAALYWTVMAWGDGFTGCVIDYGIWPEQKRRDVTLKAIKRTIARAVPGQGFEAQLYHALGQLSGQLLGRSYARENDAAELFVSRLLIDSAWGESTPVVRQFIRESPYRSTILPSFGKAVAPDNLPVSQYTTKPGDQLGQEWHKRTRGPQGAHILFDANWWKTFAHARLATPPGSPGCVSLYRGDERHHETFVAHLLAEVPAEKRGKDRGVNVWNATPNRDNHWWDCFVGCHVAASEQGITQVGHQARGKRKRVSFKEMQQRQRGNN